MKLAWILWLSSHVMPQPAADSLCLSTTVYLEARDQSMRGQEAVAEVALRRDSRLWGNSLCEVVTAASVRPRHRAQLHAPAERRRMVALGLGRAGFGTQLGAAARRAARDRPGCQPLRRARAGRPAGPMPTPWRPSAITPSIACSRSSRARDAAATVGGPRTSNKGRQCRPSCYDMIWMVSISRAWPTARTPGPQARCSWRWGG